MSKSLERSFDDLVYEDNYYKENYSEGRVVVTEEEGDESAAEQDEFVAILVCEECGHQWEDVVSEDNSDEQFCAMCGSSRVTQV
jgi:rubrerythrin